MIKSSCGAGLGWARLRRAKLIHQRYYFQGSHEGLAGGLVITTRVALTFIDKGLFLQANSFLRKRGSPPPWPSVPLPCI